MTLLSALNQWEWYRFEAFCASPYHNTQTELVTLVQFFSKERHALELLNKQEVHHAVYPKKQFSERQLNYCLSGLGKLAEQFLGMELFINSKHQAELSNLAGLSRRHLDKHVEFLKKKKERQFEQQEQRDVESYLFPSYRFYNLLSENTYRKGERKANIHVQKTADALDAFYIAEKLRLTCSMLNHQRVIATEYRFSLMDEIQSHLASSPELLNRPMIALYLAIFTLLTHEEADEEYRIFQDLLQKHQAAFSKKELTELHEYGLNFCAREIRKQRKDYVHEAFRLYKNGLEIGLFMTDNVLSPWHFKNIVRLGLRTNAIQWTENFIKEKTKLLSPDFQKDALHYNLAELYFHTQKYDEAIAYLNRVEFTDIHYNLGAKVMLAKVYWEQQESDVLESLLHAFKAFLRRNKALPPDTQRAYLNFVKWLSKINKATKSKRKTFVDAIQETELMVFKDWLLNQL